MASSLSLTSLDPTTIETALKTAMKADPNFKDYDFEGSNLAALIRILGINTHLNSFYLNMVHAEGYNDSAQKRSSILSKSKELGYTPRSARSAKATVRLTFTGTEPTYTIEKGRTFSSTVKNRGYVFSVPDNLLLASANGTFSTETDLYEGAFVSDSYVMNYSDETQRFVLSNPNVDTRSLTVVVYADGEITGKTYRKATSLFDIQEDDRVYFLQASETDQYEIIFGDGVAGYRPPDGALVLLDYRVTKGEEANGAKSFSIDFELGGGASNIKVTTIDVASGGAGAEDTESIRYYAPRHFQVQERAVTADDYKVLLKTEFPEIRAVTAFGGEEAEPPLYGRVIIALDISDVDGIPGSKRDEYYNFLKKRCGLTITPVFIDPQYTYVAVRSQVLYNLNTTTLTPSNIETLVFNAVASYADNYLNDFESKLRYSKLVAAMDASHESIVGNETELRIYKKMVLTRGVSQSFVVDFAMPLYDGAPEVSATFPSTDVRTIRSGPFLASAGVVYLTDDGAGVVWMATDKGATTVLLQKAGTVDYETGVVTITNITPTTFQGTSVKLYAKVADLDVASRRDTILTTEADEVQVFATPTRE
jgi:hypothetical protein